MSKSSQDSKGKERNTGANTNVLSSIDVDSNQLLLNHSSVACKVFLPPQCRRRIKALKKLQVESTHIEADFYTDVHKLESKYNQLYAGLRQKRCQIITGEVEPTDEECEFSLDPDADSLINAFAAQGAAGVPNPFGNVDENTKGIPVFWYTIFKNVDLLNDMVQPHDEPILKHLIDIEVEFLESDPMGFILKFVFSANEYFTNKVLTKYYEMRCQPDETDPFSFEGPEIIKCKGCTIDWNVNKNVTQKTVKKKQKHKAHGTYRTVTKTVKNDSFFNFFDPPLVGDADNEEIDLDTQAILTSDFEIGHYIRERIVPHAVLYFTGEAVEEEEDMEEEEEEDDDDVSEDSDENESGSYTKNKGDKPDELLKIDQPPECKQQ